MTTDKVLFVGGPHAGERGYLEIRERMDVEQTETPVRDSFTDPWKYDRGRDVWVCRYTRRRCITEGDFVIYAPVSWTNREVFSELLRGYLK